VVSVVYALRSGSASVAEEAGVATIAAIAESVAEGSVGEAAIAEGAVTSSGIADSSIQLIDISNNGAGEGQVIKWLGDSWTVANDEIGSGSVSDTDWTLQNSVLYTGGEWGLARAGNVLYGDWDDTHVNLGVACTTGTSGLNDWYVTVGGGYGNRAKGAGATIAGGYQNFTGTTIATVGGGLGNRASKVGATVAGGSSNTAGALDATVSGGNVNEANGDFSYVGGGQLNFASDTFSVISGGRSNEASGAGAAVGGGGNCYARGKYAVVSGGGSGSELADSNLASGAWSVIPGGKSNIASGDYSFAAGRQSRATNAGCFVWSDSTSSIFGSLHDNEFAVSARNGARFFADNSTLYGMYVQNNGNGDGIRAYTNSNAGTSWGALYAVSYAGSPAISAWAGSGLCGYFAGDVTVTGTLTKGSGAFKIDHPLDPENKYLYHSFVESPDMMNVYNGNVLLDAGGEAWVELPDWFEALNGEFRYQLTAIGAPSPNLHIAQKITGNRFKIAGGTPGLEVSWQVTGVRHDPYADAHRIPVEQYKSQEERGKYLHPAELGQSAASGINYHNDKQQQAADR
jgi:hypothetical protein